MNTEPAIASRPKDYSVEVRIRNNYLLQRMRSAGFETNVALAQAAGVSAVDVSSLLTMRKRVRYDKGWARCVVAISEFLQCMPEDIIPPRYRADPLSKTHFEFKANAEEIGVASSLKSLAVDPEDVLVAADVRLAVARSLTAVSPRQERVIRMLYGIGTEEKSPKEIGEAFGVTSARILQIADKAIRRLRHPAHSRHLRQAVGE